MSSCTKKEKDYDLNVSFPSANSISYYDPAKVDLALQYTVLETIYATLFFVNKDGDVEGMLAKEFSWDGNDLHIVIRDDVKTVDGIKIEAADVAFSLERLVKLASNTHGQINNLLRSCGKDKCDSIILDEKNNKVILQLKERYFYIIKHLATIDFAIIPRSSVDQKTLKIKDYRNTSGPYYLEQDSSEGKLVFKANKSHFFYHPQMPQVVYFIPSIDDKSSEGLLKNKKVDLLTTDDLMLQNDIFSFFNKNQKKYVLHKTLPMLLRFISFTLNGQKKFQLEERVAISDKLKFLWKSVVEKSSLMTQADQFFPDLGEGALNDLQIEEIKKIKEKLKLLGVDKNKKINLGVLKHSYDMVKDVFSSEDWINVITTDEDFFEFIKTNKVDAFFLGIDSGYHESRSLMNLLVGTYGWSFDKTFAAKWLDKYMNTMDAKARIDMVNKLHFEVLKDFKVIPLSRTPYTALSTKDWEINFPKYFSNTQLWLLRRK